MYKNKRTTIICFAILQSMVMMGQLSDPREKLSITATVDGSTNTDYRWESEDGDVLETGRVRRRGSASFAFPYLLRHSNNSIIYLYIIIIIYKLNIRYLVRIDFIK